MPKPKPQAPLVDPKSGLVSPVWHAWFAELAVRSTAPSPIAGTAVQPEYKLQGPASVRVFGLLQNGLASLALAGDVEVPEPCSYYGTNDEGAKGWHLIGDALDVTADLTKAVDGTTNVVTFGLAGLADSGSGELLAIERDAKGRVSGTKPVTAGSNITITDVGASVEIAASGGSGAAGSQIGYAYTQSTTAASTTNTSVPTDNTIPQNTEGVAYPSLDTTITPQFATSLLEVEVVIPYATNSQGGIGLRVIICRDSDADAVYACFSPIVVNAGQQVSILARTVVPANSTAATTFKVRWATSAGTGYLMSLSGTQYYGAANKASMTIREIKQ